MRNNHNEGAMFQVKTVRIIQYFIYAHVNQIRQFLIKGFHVDYLKQSVKNN